MAIDFDDLAEVFDSSRSFHPRLVSGLARGVVDLLGKGATLLDIGAGTGRFLLPITREGVDGYGIDLSERMVARARGKGLDKLVRGDAAHLPFRDGAFDAALMIYLLHLVEGWQGVVAEAARVSRRAVLSLDLETIGEDPFGLFRRLIAEKGVEITNPGPTESELAEICTPDRRIFLGEYEDRRSREEVIASFRARHFSLQAGIDDRLNEACVLEMERAYRSPEIVSSNRMTLLVWKPERLLELSRRDYFPLPAASSF